MPDPTTILGTEFAKIFLKWGFDKTVDKLGEGNLTKQKLEKAANKYANQYLHNHGKICVLGMSHPAELEKIYTKVQLIEGRNSWTYSPPLSHQKKRLDKNQRGLFDRDITQEGIKVANQHQYLMVLGQPGAGKSTFLKRIGLAALQDKEQQFTCRIRQNLPGLKTSGISDEFYEHERLPVLIELKRCISSKIDLVGKIQAELEICGFENSEKLTKILLEAGKMLVLLDGLDEIPNQYFGKAITQIQDFVNQYHQNRFIISCRTAAYEGGFSNLVKVEMADFDDGQIQQFITNWFSQDKDREVDVAKTCWELINSQDYQATKELAHTPLLLTFLCLVYDYSQAFPKNRADLYKDALEIFLKRWAAENRIQRDPIYKDLSLRLEEAMLSKIAYHQFSQDRLFFNKEEVITEIREYLANNLNAPDPPDGSEVLQAIQVQQGILVERSKSVFSFSHLTLQEYLTAQYIVDHDLVNGLVDNHLTDIRWQEVFLLVAGLIRGGTDKLLSKMVVASNRLINTDNLRILVAWAEEKTRVIGEKYLAQRHMALWIVNTIATANAINNINTEADATIYIKAYTKSYSHENAHIYTDANIHAPVYIRTYAKSYAYANAFIKAYENINSNINVYTNKHNIISVNAARLIQNVAELHIFDNIDYQKIKDTIPSNNNQDNLNAWCEALGIRLEWLNLLEPEINSLQQYFTANLLIMKCKEAAIEISNKGWAALEEKMFRVLDD
jgi:GTPase SAR1 family protein